MSNKLDDVNNKLPYPLGLPAKHLGERLPSRLTMNTIIKYYTLWNWIVMLIALGLGWPRIVLYSQASCILVACIIIMAWLLLGWPFIKQFYESVLLTKTTWLIILADFIIHFLPVLIMGLPYMFALPVVMPFLTFWVWYMAVRTNLKKMYASEEEDISSADIDNVAIWGSFLWIFIIVLIVI